MHFFFSENSEQQRSAAFAVCALLHQLFSQYEHLFAVLGLRAHSLHGQSLTSDFDALWELLLETARHTGLRNVVCVLDGLDECRKDEAHRLMQKLKAFYQHRDENLSSKEQATVKFFVTSRPYLEMETNFDESIHLPPDVRMAADPQAELISSDIALVARARIEDIGRSRRLLRQIREIALSMVLDNNGSTYLWQNHIFEALSNRSLGNVDELRSVILQLPAPVENIYENMLSQSPDPVRATKILKIIVAATRPLTLSEMDTALAIERCPAAYNDLQLCGDGYTALHIRYICGFFLKIVDTRIYPIHSTARPFLIETGCHASTKWKGSLCLSECHLTLATICVQYLLHGELRTTSALEGSDGERLKFRDYSIRNWAAHVRKSGVGETHQLTNLALQLYRRSERWWLGCIRSIPGPQPFYRNSHVLNMCGFGHVQILRRIQIRGESDTTLVAGLRLATIAGHSQTVQFLLEVFADKKITIPCYVNDLLHIAVWYGYEDVVKQLLARGASVNSVTNYDCTALHIATLRGDDSMVKVLVDAGAILNAVRHGEGMAHHAAAEHGFGNVMQVLIKAGANLGAYQRGCGTALHIAARSGHTMIVNMLLDAGIDANIEKKGDGIALYVALAAGHEKIVDILSTVSDIDVKSDGYWRVLTRLSLRGDEMSVARLLDLSITSEKDLHDFKYREVDGVDATCVERRTAKDTVETFTGAYRTVLKRASARGDVRLVSLLLDTVDVVPRETLGLNPALRAAAAKGHLSIVTMLRKAGAQANVAGAQLGTALQAAREAGHWEIVKLLDKREAEKRNHMVVNKAA